MKLFPGGWAGEAYREFTDSVLETFNPLYGDENMDIAGKIMKIVKKLITKIRLLNTKSRIVQRHGCKYLIDYNQDIDRGIYFELFESNTVKQVKKIIKKDMVVLDIGANIGFYTILFSHLVGMTGKVYAFEPMTYALGRCLFNMRLNYKESGNIICEKLALSDISGINKMSFKNSWPLDTEPETDVANTISEYIEMKTLDSYVRDNKINRIDAIKIDVDGYEYKVIRGASNTLDLFHPILIMEFGKYTLERVGDSLESMMSSLLEKDYHFFDEETDKEMEKADILSKIPVDETINVICRRAL